MKIDSLQQLKELVKLCRKLGIDAIEADNVKFNLGPEPKKPTKSKPFELEDPLAHAKIEIPTFNPVSGSTGGSTVPGKTGPGATFTGMTEEVKAQVEKIATEELTEDQLLNWSVRPEEHAN